MNLIDVFVTEIIGTPYFEYNKWWLKAKVNAYGGIDETTLMFQTKQDALNVKIGDKFLK